MSIEIQNVSNIGLNLLSLLYHLPELRKQAKFGVVAYFRARFGVKEDNITLTHLC
jgi:hypothetical protein